MAVRATAARATASCPRASRRVTAVFGVLAALAGIEHSIGAIRQGNVAPPAIVIESWPSVEAFAILAGEPALTLVPNLLVSGLLTIGAASVLGLWVLRLPEGRRGALGLIVLSLLLLLVGGGFGPPLLGLILGVGWARGHSSRQPRGLGRALAPWWRWLTAAGAAGFLGLFPGMVLLSAFAGIENAGLVVGCAVLAFGGLLLALPAARAADVLAASEPPAPRRAR